ncbi:MAG: class II aldolase/adducin family protein [Pseudomonadota bacterium]
MSLAARKAMIDVALRMERAGLNQGTSGNLAVREGGGLLLTPSGMA